MNDWVKVLFDPRDRIYWGPPSKAPDKPWRVEFRKDNSATPMSKYDIPEFIRKLNEEWRLGYNEWVLSEHLKSEEGARLFIDIAQKEVHYGLEDQHPKAKNSIWEGLIDFYSKKLPELITKMCGEVLEEDESYRRITSEKLYYILEDLFYNTMKNIESFSPYATEKGGCNLTAIVFNGKTEPQGILIKMSNISN